MLSSALRESLGHKLDNDDYSYIADHAIELDEMRLEHGSDDAELYGKMLNLFGVGFDDVEVESVECNKMDCPCYIMLDGSDLGCGHCTEPYCEECCEQDTGCNDGIAFCDGCDEERTAMDEMRVVIKSRSS